MHPMPSGGGVPVDWVQRATRGDARLGGRPGSRTAKPMFLSTMSKIEVRDESRPRPTHGNISGTCQEVAAETVSTPSAFAISLPFCYDQMSSSRIAESMEAKPHRRVVTSHITRPGQSAPTERGWEGSTPEERINAVWDLTLLCLAWNGDPASEPRLQRSVSRVQRPRR